MPKLLTQLDIEGAVITMDAMGYQTKIADQIIQQGADYVLSLKGNQGELHQGVREFFASALSPAIGDIRYEGEHGRVETRSIRETAQRLGNIVRAHWSIENNLHWVLDQAFDEDDQRTRVGHNAANMAVMRHIAPSLTENGKNSKSGCKN